MMHRTRRAGWAGMAGLVTLAGACALANPPSEGDAPTHGGLPQGVSAGPAATQVGPLTSPVSAAPEQAPSPTRQPMGNYLEERTPLVGVDSNTRAIIAQLDSVIGGVSRGLTRMPVPVARGLIQGLVVTLGGEGRAPRVRAVATELQTLDGLLAQSTIDGRAVGRQLQRLSARAQAATPEAGVLAGRVARIADQLAEAGGRMAEGQSDRQ